MEVEMILRSIGLAVLASCIANVASAATVVAYGFEDVTPSTEMDGRLSRIAVNTQGLRAEITRPGSRFDVVERGDQPVPLSFGERALSPFSSPMENNSFIINFATPVLRFSIGAGDFGQDSPDRIVVSAFSGEDLTGSRLDIERVSVRSPVGSNDFSFEDVSVSSERLIRSIELSGGSFEFPQSVYWSGFSTTLPTDRETTLIGSYTAAIDRAKFGPTRDQSINDFIACSQDSSCNLDEAYLKTQEDVRTITEPLADAAFASRDLVTRSSILPSNAIETLLDAPFFFENVLDGMKRMGRLDLFFDGTVESVEASGDGGSFRINPFFDFLDLEIHFDLPSDSLDWDGQAFTYFSDVSLLGNTSAAGLMEFSETSGGAFGSRRIALKLTQLESSDFAPLAPVPLPSGLWLLVVSIGVFGLLKRCARTTTVMYAKASEGVIGVARHDFSMSERRA
jgi:hypothetical protein